MGIYSRDYYRDSRSSGGAGNWGLYGLTPVVKGLILANIAVFLLQIFVVREVRQSPLEQLRKHMPEIDRLLREKGDDPKIVEALKKKYLGHADESPDSELDYLFLPPERVAVVQEWLQLDTNKVVSSGQVWRLLTCAFCHDRYALWHILFNMLFLYWFGCTLESMYGSREFLLFYLTAAVFASLAFVGLDLYTGSSIPAIGASGAVMAVMMLYTMHFPYESIRIFGLFSIEMRWVMILYMIWDLHPVLLAVAGDQYRTGVAHAAHLGGLAFGFLYAKYQWRLAPWSEYVGELLSRLRWRRRPRLRLCAVEDGPAAAEPATDMARLDELLQKICDSGQASLTDEERTILRNASEQLKTHTNRNR